MATALGNRLRIAREELGLTRADVARRAQVDNAQLYRIESSDNAQPTFACVVRLARVLGVNIEWLAITIDDTDAPIPLDAMKFDEPSRRAFVNASKSMAYIAERLRLPIDDNGVDIQVDAAANAKRQRGSKPDKERS